MAGDKELTVDFLREMFSPQTTAQPAQQQQSQPMTVAELEKVTAPKPQPTVGFGEDFGRSVAAGLGTGAIGLAGMPGDVRNLVELGLQKTGLGSLGERYVPTSAEMIAKAKEVMPSIKGHLEYTPEYTASRYAKTAAEFLPGAVIPGGGLSLGARAAGSVGAGLATQGVEEYLKGTPAEGTGYETAAKIAASIPGFMLGKGAYSGAQGVVGGALRPGAEAERRAAEAYGKDIARGGSYGVQMTPAEVAASGVPVPPAATAGKSTEKLMVDAAQRAPASAVTAYEKAIDAIKGTGSDIAQTSPASRVGAYIDNLFGGQPVNALDEISQIQSRARQVNSQNYGQVMQLPNAQNVGGKNLDIVVSRLPKGVIDETLEALRESGTGFTPKSLGMVATKDGWVLNPQGMPLRFWDEVKQTLDTKINKLKDPTTGKITDTGAWGRWNETNKQLKTALDNAVPEYAPVRGAAAEAAGATNAIDLGTKYLGANNPKQIAMIERTVKGMTPEQQYDFAYGVAGGFKELLGRDPKAALALFGGSKGGDRVERLNKALMPLGDDAGYKLVGQANAELLNLQLKSLPVGGGQVKSLLPYAPGLIGGAVQLGEMLLQPALWAGNPSAFATMLVGMAGGKLYNWKEARVASEVLSLLSDPAKHAELGRLAARDAAARSFLGKTTNYLGRAGAPALGVEAREKDASPINEITVRPAQTSRGQAAGGRIGRATGGRTNGMMTAEMLMQAAHAAKKKINKTTEEILNAPDEAVVKALSVAKQHI